MAPKAKRIENEVRRKDKVKSAESSKRQRVKSEAKQEQESAMGSRRSLRTQGIPPAGVCDEQVPGKPLNVVSRDERMRPRVAGPLSMSEARDGGGPHGQLVATLLSSMGPVMKEENEQLDLGSMKLEANNFAQVVSSWPITDVKFLPCSNMRMVVAGSKSGNVGFWNMDSGGRYLFRPHSGPISGLVFQESCISQMFTSCYDGYVRMMDVKKEAFMLVRENVERVTCLSKPAANDDKSLYLGDGNGGLTVWDTKMGKPCSQWHLHDNWINTIHFNPRDPMIMATAARDGSARIWDLRVLRRGRPHVLKEVKHEGAVNSAYFSPSGDALATLSWGDDCVRIQSGPDFEAISVIPHVHKHGGHRFLPKFRAIWGWDDSYIFVANKARKAIDVISPAQTRLVMTLESPAMKQIPCRFDAHPRRVGMLAGATAGGQVYVWTCT